MAAVKISTCYLAIRWKIRGLQVISLIFHFVVCVRQEFAFISAGDYTNLRKIVLVKVGFFYLFDLVLVVVCCVAGP